MDNSLTDAQVQAVASEIFALLRSGRQISPISSRSAPFAMADAYRVALAVRQMREKAGERVIGRKIGFTNRTIWPEYQVFEPIWGYVYDRTVHKLADLGGTFALAGLSEPRLEPEIMFKFASAPNASMSDVELLDCIEWVAHGFEIVQSLFPAWKFSASDTVAAYGLHGALLIGEPVRISGDTQAWRDRLENFEIDLTRGEEFVDRGKAQNVLDGPVKALQHLIGLLSRQNLHPPIAAGEIVTTGTLTRAMPIGPGEAWNTRLSPPLLPGARIRFA